MSRWLLPRRARLAVVVSLCLLAAGAAPAAAAGPAASPSAAGGDAANARTKAIVTFRARPGREADAALAAAGAHVRFRYRLIPSVAIEVPAQALDGLRRNPLVAAVELDHTIVAFDHTGDTGDLEYENAWGVEHIGSKPVHDAGIRGQGINVAVIDTGLDYIHDDPDDQPYVVDPEFLGNYKGGYDFVNNDADPMDDNGHGTHVAGILAAEHNGYLVVGVAPEVNLYSLKVLGATGEGDYSGLIAALDWAADPAHHMDVVNISLGGHDVSAALQAEVQAAFAAGVTMVAAAGNINPLDWNELLYGCPVAYPAAYPQVLATTYTNGNDALTGYSCTGPEVDFASPGDNIFSTVPLGSCMFCSPYGYAAESGTSMASPHLAGTVALLLQAGLTDVAHDGFLNDAKAQLCATADVGWGVQSGFASTQIPPNDPRYPNYFGCGVINADGAILPLLPPTPGNNPPVGTDDVVTTAEDTAVDVAVLANDTDPDGDPLTVTATSDPANGTASINADGTIHYVPDANANGDDGFDYTVSDGNGGTDLVAVTVHVTPVPDAPLAVDDTLTTAEDTPASVTVLANDTDADGDALAVTAVSDPAHGAATIGAGGTIGYTPDPNYSGTDSFTYTVSDGTSTDGGAVSVTVTPVNDPPNAVNDVATTPYQTPITIAVLGNDTDIDGGALTILSTSDPVNGTVVVNANGTLTYGPNAGFSGVDAFTYTISDGAGGLDSATVSITVGAAPVSNALHVGDLDGSTSSSKTQWTARVTVRVHAASEAAVSGVTVTGTWSTGGSMSCTTNRSGVCSVQTAKLSRASVASVTFTVTNAVRSGWTYDPSANHDPDGDSSGSAITIARPT